MKWIKRFEKLDARTYKTAGRELKNIGKYERGQKLIDYSNTKSYGVYNFWATYKADMAVNTARYTQFVYDKNHKEEKLQSLEFTNPSCDFEFYGDNKTVEDLIQSWSEGKSDLGFNLKFKFEPMRSSQDAPVASSNNLKRIARNSDGRVGLFDISFTIAGNNPHPNEDNNEDLIDKFERNAWSFISLESSCYGINQYSGIFSDRKSAVKFKNDVYNDVIEKYYDKIYDIFSAIGVDSKDFEYFIYKVKNIRVNFLYDDELADVVSKTLNKNVSEVYPERRWYEKDMSGKKPRPIKNKEEKEEKEDTDTENGWEDWK